MVATSIGGRLWRLFLVALALVLLFEQWVWARLQGVGRAIGRWPPLSRVNSALDRLSPGAAVLVMLAPAALLLPVKTMALVAMGKGHVALAIFILAAAKVAGTAAAAWMFDRVKVSARRVQWFDRGCTWVELAAAWSRGWLELQPWFTKARDIGAELRTRARGVIRRGRRMRRMRAVLRQRALGAPTD